MSQRVELAKGWRGRLALAAVLLLLLLLVVVVSEALTARPLARAILEEFVLESSNRRCSPKPSRWGAAPWALLRVRAAYTAREMV